MTPVKLLILGGTTEAGALARALVGDDRFAPVLSLAGATRAPVAPPIPWRLGGFGGVAGLAAHLAEQGVALMVDATHPFAARMSAHAVAAAAQAGVPLLVLRRPPWVAVPGDRWQVVAGMAEAAAALGPLPRRVFLTIGQKELAPFQAAPQHDYVIRSVDPPAPATLPPRTRLIAARGPFDAAAEHALLVAEGIEVLVTKNSGGSAVSAKLDAARRLGLPVIMVRRPPAPEAATVATVEAALAWLYGRASARA